MKQGKLTQWNGAKGFGFIQSESGERVFVHISVLKRGGLARPKSGDVVYFEQGSDAKGRVQAVKAGATKELLKNSSAQNRGAAKTSAGARDWIDYLLMGLLPLLLLLVLSSPARVLLLALIGVSSAAVFALYWLDKRQAERKAWRVPEAYLQIVSLFGGWPGAWLAQQSLRHKTQKTSFRIVFFACAMLNVVAAGYLLVNPQLLAIL